MKWVRVPAESEAPVVGTRRRFRLFAFWGVGVVLAWGRGLPDD